VAIAGLGLSVGLGSLVLVGLGLDTKPGLGSAFIRVGAKESVIDVEVVV
jgi:hypothetical protein